MEIEIKRCAIYTRKSTDEGLDHDFNSLDAQRQAGEHYISSQKAKGWVCLEKHYDDGGYSGGTLERPAIQELLADAQAGLLDIIVVYKLDRLTRSLCDFAELSRKLDQWNVSFVSVTQDINTSTSHGRMMLNILLSFAQYEREVTAERIRDKMAASRQRGKFVGGSVPYGYIAVNRKLEVVPEAAEHVRWIFQRFCEVQSPKQIAYELNSRGLRTRAQKRWNLGTIYRMLHNYTYIGSVEYKGKVYPGEQDAIVGRAVWDCVQEILHSNNPVKNSKGKAATTAALKGLIRCGHCDGAMGPTYKRKGGKVYHYYLCSKDSKRDRSICPVRRVPAGDIEQAVVEQLGNLLCSSSFVAQVAQNLQIAPRKVMGHLGDIHNFWSELFPIERNRLLELLIQQVTVREDGLSIEIKTAGLRGLIDEVTNA